MTTNRPRGLVILAVLLIVAASALVALSVITTGAAVRGHAEASTRQGEAEAAVWSGVQQALAEITAQRSEILAGATPVLTTRTELYQTPAGERAIARLVDLSEPDPFAHSAVIALAEGAFLNANSASAEMLAALPGVDEATAARVVRARAEAPFTSVTEVARRAAVTDAGALAALCVFAADPELECGVTDPARCGDERLDITAEWSDAFAESIDNRFGEGAAEAVRGIRERGTPLGSRADLVGVLVSLGVETEGWGEVFDALCFGTNQHAVGRVDLTRADADVLSSIPGIDADAARDLVSTRQRLSAEELRSITWPVEYRVLTAEAFAQASAHLSSRSTQWRIRVEGGFTRADTDDTLSGAELRDLAAYDPDEPLISARTWEVVIDAAEDPPRIASLKDVTLERAWAAIARERAPDAQPPEAQDANEPGSPAPPARAPAAEGPSDAAPAPVPTRRIGRWLPVGGDA